MIPRPGVCRRCEGNFSRALPVCKDCGRPICEECTALHKYDHVPDMFRPTIILRYRDEAGQHRWRLKAANGEIIAASHRGWDTPEGADRNVRDLTDALLAPLNVGVLRDSAGEWRWHADDDDGNTIGKSSEGFVSRHNAERNQQLVTERLSYGFTIEDEDTFDLDSHKAEFGTAFDAAKPDEELPES